MANFDNVVETGEYLDGPDSYALCEEIVRDDFGNGEKDYQLAMGGASAPDGLSVDYGVIFGYGHCGLFLLRKF